MHTMTTPDNNTSPDEMRGFLSAEAARRERAHALVELAKADYLNAPFSVGMSIIDAAVAYRAAVRHAEMADDDYARAEREYAAVCGQPVTGQQTAEGEDQRLAELLAEFDAQQDRS